jgi:hypothetical protein
MAKAKNECVVDVTNHLARALIAAHGAAAADFAELALADCLHVGLIEASVCRRNDQGDPKSLLAFLRAATAIKRIFIVVSLVSETNNA